MDSYLGEIRIFPFNFAPKNWATCDGQLMPISQNTALFSLLGTNYGGNGINIFGLPDLRGRVPLHQGAGPGLTPRSVGEEGGEAAVTLTSAQMPPHTHSLLVDARPASLANPAGHALARVTGATPYAQSVAPVVPMALQAISVGQGGNQPHNNMQPFLAMNFNICLNGIFPPRS